MKQAIVDGANNPDSAFLRAFTFDDCKEPELIELCKRKKYNLIIDHKEILKKGKEVEVKIL